MRRTRRSSHNSPVDALWDAPNPGELIESDPRQRLQPNHDPIQSLLTIKRQLKSFWVQNAVRTTKAWNTLSYMPRYAILKASVPKMPEWRGDPIVTVDERQFNVSGAIAILPDMNIEDLIQGRVLLDMLEHYAVKDEEQINLDEARWARKMCEEQGSVSDPARHTSFFFVVPLTQFGQALDLTSSAKPQNIAIKRWREKGHILYNDEWSFFLARQQLAYFSLSALADELRATILSRTSTFNNIAAGSRICAYCGEADAKDEWLFCGKCDILHCSYVCQDQHTKAPGGHRHEDTDDLEDPKDINDDLASSAAEERLFSEDDTENLNSLDTFDTFDTPSSSTTSLTSLPSPTISTSIVTQDMSASEPSTPSTKSPSTDEPVSAIPRRVSLAPKRLSIPIIHSGPLLPRSPTSRSFRRRAKKNIVGPADTLAARQGLLYLLETLKFVHKVNDELDTADHKIIYNPVIRVLPYRTRPGTQEPIEPPLLVINWTAANKRVSKYPKAIAGAKKIKDWAEVYNFTRKISQGIESMMISLPSDQIDRKQRLEGAHITVMTLPWATCYPTNIDTDIDSTRFRVMDDHYCWERIPPGFSNAASTIHVILQQLITDMILSPTTRIINHLDYIIILQEKENQKELLQIQSTLESAMKGILHIHEPQSWQKAVWERFWVIFSSELGGAHPEANVSPLANPDVFFPLLEASYRQRINDLYVWTRCHLRGLYDGMKDPRQDYKWFVKSAVEILPFDLVHALVGETNDTEFESKMIEMALTREGLAERLSYAWHESDWAIVTEALQKAIPEAESVESGDGVLGLVGRIFAERIWGVMGLR